jgi:orotate phosphoribosyltransferase
VIIGHEVAAALGVPFRFTERKGEEMGLRRGFEIKQGERVVIVEDVVTTGRSTLETASLATSRGARVVAIGSIIDRTAGRDPFDVPFRSLLALDLPSYPPGECPLCKAGAAAPEKPGSRPEPTAADHGGEDPESAAGTAGADRGLEGGAV